MHVANTEMPKWRQEVEEILSKHFPSDSEKLQRAKKLVDIALEVEVPTRDTKVVWQLLHWASEGLKPLTAVYIAFQLGVACERCQ